MRSIRLCLFLAFMHAGALASASEPPQTFSAQELRQDLAELETQIYRIHPDVEHSVRKADLARALSGVRARLDRSMTREEAWVTMAALNPVMADGHLVVTYPGGSGAEIAAPATRSAMSVEAPIAWPCARRSPCTASR